MKASIKGVVLYHLFPSLHGTQYKYFSKKLTYKERISRTVAAATGGGEVSDWDLQIGGYGYPTFN